eukprot:scaffold77510_cov29-Prasinocladus_malaysianus.AAC.1
MCRMGTFQHQSSLASDSRLAAKKGVARTDVVVKFVETTIGAKKIQAISSEISDDRLACWRRIVPLVGSTKLAAANKAAASPS